MSLLIVLIVLAVLVIIGIGAYAYIIEEKESGIFCFILSALIVLAILCCVHQCPDCGHLSIGDGYCKECGQVVENNYWLTGERRKCPICNAHVGKDQKYCTECGRCLQN